MKIRIDWYKESGKWYAGEEIEISGNYHIWEEEFLQEIVDNQNQLIDGWQADQFIVVTGDLQKYAEDRNYQKFYHQLFPQGRFLGIKKRKREQ